VTNGKFQIINVVPRDLEGKLQPVKSLVEAFIADSDPLERERLHVLVDARTKAQYCECHIKASRLVNLSTIDVPLDPEEQPDYRANRELVEDNVAFQVMKEDAKQRRAFSNIVAEYTTTFDPSHPIKIIGGQHRFTAIQEALSEGIDEFQGLKVYFGLDPEQRLDVQLISNTNIAVSADLFDRMQETLAGPELRTWCQEVGLLERGADFADRRQRGRQITVKAARTFILNFYKGVSVRPADFEKTDTTAVICKTGAPDAEWERLKASKPEMRRDLALKIAGTEFAKLVSAQRDFITRSGSRASVDFAEKASNFAIIAAWAFVAGALTSNVTRLKRHFGLKDEKRRDPLNADALAHARHKTDPELACILSLRISRRALSLDTSRPATKSREQFYAVLRDLAADVSAGDLPEFLAELERAKWTAALRFVMAKSPAEGPNPLLTVEQVAGRLRVSEAQVYRLAKTTLRSAVVEVGERTLRFAPDRLARFIDSKRRGG
jgi:hypothetical protein